MSFVGNSRSGTRHTSARVFRASLCLHTRGSARLANDTLNSKGKRYPDANGAH